MHIIHINKHYLLTYLKLYLLTYLRQLTTLGRRVFAVTVPTYYDQCQSSTTSTVVKAPLICALLVKRRYIKYLALPIYLLLTPNIQQCTDCNVNPKDPDCIL